MQVDPAWFQRLTPYRGKLLSNVAFISSYFNLCHYTQGLWKEAFDLYREMRAKGIHPTSHTYSALIRGRAVQVDPVLTLLAFNA